jgi:hypothetical protein
MAFGVAMLPEDVPGVSLQACAGGSYDSYWRKFGTVISSYGLGRSIIRLGWEFNGNWYVWKATNATTWAQCWRQVVTSARSTAPGLQWDWNVGRGLSTGLADPTLAYPGNAYVSMIGIDSYDWWPPAKTAAGWQTQLNGRQGLNYWLAFAKAHGKLLSVPEWGNASAGESAGGDDPQYVEDMRTFFAANAAEIAFECNFQGPPSSGGGSYGPGTLVPQAAMAYKAAFLYKSPQEPWRRDVYRVSITASNGPSHNGHDPAAAGSSMYPPGPGRYPTPPRPAPASGEGASLQHPTVEPRSGL